MYNPKTTKLVIASTPGPPAYGISVMLNNILRPPPGQARRATGERGVHLLWMHRFISRDSIRFIHLFILSTRCSVDMKTVLITGANRGIGLHLAKLYLEKGYRVVAACRDPSKMPDLGGGDKFVSIKLDQSSKTDAREVSRPNLAVLRRRSSADTNRRPRRS